ncbi:MAG TPA: sigma-70 family RNA polymerase sigma factor [Planctomycetota bacterium]|nr:sigma-70 family RNA polymerase sigma factor [Planctomycetota bacterium]
MHSDRDALRSDELLGQLGWVRALARSLVRDPEVTDDVLQQVCLLALQGLPQEAETGPRLRAWLSTATQRLASHAGRAERRRQRHEKAAARPEALPSTIDVAAHREALRGLVEAVTSLEEPFYSAIVARYFEGRSVAEIAALRGISTGAVHQQLSRARRTLRSRLEAYFADRRLGWLLAALPRAPVSAASSASARAVLASLGGLVVAKSVFLAATAIGIGLVVAGAVLFVRPSERPAEPEPVVQIESQTASEPASAVLPDPAARMVESAVPARAPVGVRASAMPSEPAEAPTAYLRILVVDPAGHPVEGAEVISDRGQPRRRLTNGEGLAQIGAPPGEAVRLAARHDAFRLATGNLTLGDEAGSVTDVRLQLGDGLPVCLEVMSRDGRPIEGACVRLREGSDGSDTKDNLVGTAADLQRCDDSDRLEGQVQETRATDSQGRCCVNGVRSGAVIIHVDADGYVPL